MNARRLSLGIRCISCGERQEDLIVVNLSDDAKANTAIVEIALCEGCVMQAAQVVTEGAGGLLDRLAGMRRQITELAQQGNESVVRAKLFDFASLFQEIILDSTFTPSQRCAIAAGVAMALKSGARMLGAGHQLAMLFETGTETLQRYRARRPYSPPTITELGTLEPGTTDPDAAFDQISRALEGK